MIKEKEKSKQHVQLPNDMTQKSDLEPNDLLVYVTLKRHMNKETKECFPSLQLLSKECGFSIPTIRKSITLLTKSGYINVRKQGRKNVYNFNAYKNFEPFSYDFLDQEGAEPNEKAYVVASQQHMIKDNEGIGKMSYTKEELGQLINLSPRTIARLDKSLEAKGFLTIVRTKKVAANGVVINEKFFKLNELGQAIIWTLQKHDEDIEKLKVSTESNEKDIQMVLREVDELKKEIAALKGNINKGEVTL